MAKVVISATVDEETEKKVRILAEDDRRSFSQMVDLLLVKALENLEPKKETIK